MPTVLIVARSATGFPSLLRTYLAARGLQASISCSLEDIGQMQFADLPGLVLLELGDLEQAESLLKDPALSHIPFVCYSTDEVPQSERIHALELGATDCLGKPLNPLEVFLRSKNLLNYTGGGNLHPFMAGFPGNSAAAGRLQRLLEDQERRWALMWVGVDNLSVFYHVYGYDAGNEALEIVATALDAGIRQAGQKWDAAYWVGGEDFVLFTAPEPVKGLADAIFEAFEERIGGVYSPADREAGGFTALDRRGSPYQTPLLSLSIGVITNESRRFSDAWQVRRVAQEVRTKASQIVGNSLYIDARKG